MRRTFAESLFVLRQWDRGPQGLGDSGGWMNGWKRTANVFLVTGSSQRLVTREPM